MISPEYKKGGIGYYVYNLLNKLLERNHELTLYTRGSINKTIKEIDNNITIYKTPILPIYPFHIFSQGYFLNKLLSKEETSYDLIHCHSPIIPVPKSNLPIITTIHTLYKNDTKNIEHVELRAYVEKLQSKFLYSTEMDLFNKSRQITTVSRKLVKEIYDYGFHKNNVSYLGNGVDEGKYHPNNKDYKNDEMYILFVGRIGYRKGVFDFLKCAESLIEQKKNVRFFMIGTGPLLEKVKKSVQEKNLMNKIEIPGYISENRLLELYRNAYLILIPSYYEGLPNVLLESMSSGVPAIATNVGGIPEVINNGKNGIIVKPGQIDEMINSIINLLEDKNTRDLMGVNARNTIEKEYTWSKICSRMENFYHQII
jgi:glycosyltransferase involved in cell wall biosynthesis